MSKQTQKVPLTLVMIDTVGIQSYIFGSNRLRENVGASHLVYLATRGWLLSSPDEFLPIPHNIRNGVIDPDLGIEQDALAAEVVIAAGGNTMILFCEQRDAVRFSSVLSSRLICDAPGLDGVCVHQAVPSDKPLAESVSEGWQALRRKKAEREYSHPLLGVGVTARCRSTGLVANYVEVEPGESGRFLPISAESRSKWQQNNPAKDRLRASLPSAHLANMAFPDQLDHLGRTKGDFSYIAVVHADGNGIGKLGISITEQFRNRPPEENRLYIQRLRNFSDAVDRAGLAALAAVVDKVSRWNLGHEPDIAPYIANGQKYLSIRPVVFGGDDVTFICDGRIGLKLAQLYLLEFGRQRIPDADNVEHAAIGAAGVAIVKSHYPIARAYQLSEELCTNAKTTFERKVAALDWHTTQGGLFGSLSEIREREFRTSYGSTTSHGSLLMRPVSVGDDPVSDWHTWGNFERLQRIFRDETKWPRTRVMALREALRTSEQAIKSFVMNHDQLPEIESKSTQYVKTGWDNNRCVYFDAIDMIEQELLP